MAEMWPMKMLARMAWNLLLILDCVGFVRACSIKVVEERQIQMKNLVVSLRAQVTFGRKWGLANRSILHPMKLLGQ
jgi:hypothetical protein